MFHRDCVFPPATPGVIHIKPLRGFVYEMSFSGCENENTSCFTWVIHIKNLQGFEDIYLREYYWSILDRSDKR